MIIQIKDDKELQKKIEPEMHLFLKQSGKGVNLMGMDARGKEWFIANIGERGLKVYGAISTATGWPLDRGRALPVRHEGD